MLVSPPKSYLYGQYADDKSLKATRDAYNTESSDIFSWMQTTPISDHRSDKITGNLLDWLAGGIYNMSRKVMVSATTGTVTGSIGDVVLGDVPLADGNVTQPNNIAINLSDDQFKRSITWNTYSGDGWIFNTDWLRRRITRFMFSANGYSDFNVADMQLVDIRWTDIRTASIFVTAPALSSVVASILSIGINNGYLQTPIGYTFNVSLINYQTSHTDFGGDIL